jgi:hypothetical protein
MKANIQIYYDIYELLAAVLRWDATLRSFVDKHQRFWETNRLHPQGRRTGNGTQSTHQTTVMDFQKCYKSCKFHGESLKMQQSPSFLRNSLYLWNLKCSLLCSQQPATDLHSHRNRIWTFTYHLFKISFKIIHAIYSKISHLVSSLRSLAVCMYSYFPVHATCSALSILLDVICHTNYADRRCLLVILRLSVATLYGFER